MSKIFFDESKGIVFNTSSTIISVSGLGIKTFELTLNFSFQNSLYPTM